MREARQHLAERREFCGLYKPLLHGRELSKGVRQLVIPILEDVARLLEMVGHLVEAPGKTGELVISSDGNPVRELAIPQVFRTDPQGDHCGHEVPDQRERHARSDQEGDQEDSTDEPEVVRVDPHPRGDRLIDRRRLGFGRRWKVLAQ